MIPCCSMRVRIFSKSAFDILAGLLAISTSTR